MTRCVPWNNPSLVLDRVAIHARRAGRSCQASNAFLSWSTPSFASNLFVVHQGPTRQGICPTGSWNWKHPHYCPLQSSRKRCRLHRHICHPWLLIVLPVIGRVLKNAQGVNPQIMWYPSRRVIQWQHAERWVSGRFEAYCLAKSSPRLLLIAVGLVLCPQQWLNVR